MEVASLDHFGLARRLLALRKLVAWVSLFAFLIVGFAHSVHDFSSSLGAPTRSHSATFLQTSNADTAKDPTAITMHCHACEIVLMTVQSDAPPDDVVAFQVPVSHLGSFRPHGPAAETPPPIAMF